LREAVRWVLLRAVLYAVVAIVAITGAGFAYSSATGSSLSGSSHSTANLLAWLHVGFGVAVLGGGLTLMVLAFVAPYRRRLSALNIRLIVLPVLLLPVLFVDLVGASPSFTLGLLGMQVLYVLIMPA
jgi:hypothetical protein